MLEKALHGGKTYWTWVGILLAITAVGFLAYLYQYFRRSRYYGHEQGRFLGILHLAVYLLSRRGSLWCHGRATILST